MKIIEKYKNIPFDDTWSNCCGAQITPEGDVCMSCLEHCDVCVDCETCDGFGFTRTGESEFAYCEECARKGYIKI